MVMSAMATVWNPPSTINHRGVDSDGACCRQKGRTSYASDASRQAGPDKVGSLRYLGFRQPGAGKAASEWSPNSCAIWSARLWTPNCRRAQLTASTTTLAVKESDGCGGRRTAPRAMHRSR